VPDAAGRGGTGPRARRPASEQERPSATEQARPSVTEQISRAREALAAARAAARADGRSLIASPAPAPPGDATGPQAAEPGSLPTPAVPAPRAEPSRAARRVRRDDPQALGLAIERLLDVEGWSQAAATGSVFGRWAQIVGTDLAGHTKPESLRDGELTVIADSTAWATQVRLLSAQLVHRLNAELGHGTVLRVKVRGPVTVDRKPGEWRVRGSRGPRDTYG
jgi:predicted nucleic acid-binding Zn ribbon protein